MPRHKYANCGWVKRPTSPEKQKQKKKKTDSEVKTLFSEASPS